MIYFILCIYPQESVSIQPKEKSKKFGHLEEYELEPF